MFKSQPSTAKGEQTRTAIFETALELFRDRGFDRTTMQDIAVAAGVAKSAAYYYFPSKEAALFGTDPELIPVLRERMIHTAPGEPALEALRMIMVSDARAVADELGELGGNPVDWLRRMKGAHADSHLRAARAAQMAMVERAIAEGLAERLGTDPERDPYPSLLAATAAGAFRASLSFWAGLGGTVPLEHLIDQAFRALADGLPERRELRNITGKKDNT